MEIKKHLCIVALMTAIITASCIDERYDMDDISEDMHFFENGISFPLLQTGDLYFEDMISEEDQISVNANGVYEFGSNREQLDVELEIIDKVKVPEQNLSFGAIKSFDAVILPGSLTVDLPAEITSYESNLHAETATIDSKITYIESIYTHDEWISTIKLAILDASGASLSEEGGLKVEKVEFNDYKLVLPSVLILDKSEVSASDDVTVTTDVSTNTLTLNGAVYTNEMIVYVKLKGVNVGAEAFVNNKIVLDEEVALKGDIKLTISNSGVAKVQTLQIRPSVYIPQVYMDEAFASADVSDELENEKVYIGSLPEFLKSPETSLILTNPYVPIVIETTIPVEPVYADIVLIPRDENDNNIFDDNGNPIVINIDKVSIPGDDHATSGPTTFYRYVACQRIPELENLGYEFIECENLGMITKEIPAYIEVSGRGYTDPNAIFDFYMGEEYYAKLGYEVRVPFMVEENTCIVYEDETSDLNSDLFESLKVSVVYANAKIKNGFPADMTLEVTAYDVNGNELNGVEILVPQTIKASKTTQLTENVEPTESDVRLEIRELVQGELQKLDQLKYRVKVLFPDKGLISKYQTLNMKIDLELPEGMGINIDNL